MYKMSWHGQSDFTVVASSWTSINPTTRPQRSPTKVVSAYPIEHMPKSKSQALCKLQNTKICLNDLVMSIGLPTERSSNNMTYKIKKENKKPELTRCAHKKETMQYNKGENQHRQKRYKRIN